MQVVAVVLAGLLLIAMLRIAVRLLGWPRDMAGFRRWAIALVLSVLCLPLIPHAIGLLRDHRPESIDLWPGSGVAVIVFLGLALVGYVAWHRDRTRARQPEPRLLPRRRALPPPPGHAGAGELPIHHFEQAEAQEDPHDAQIP
ncbi:MAG: hypothetical protein HY898_27940 [Deltaproteobacteria bacterium]|nr:hypothetical protein [Deltaproteobacteria bacterium]